jgi:hypothetical protein
VSQILSIEKTTKLKRREFRMNSVYIIVGSHDEASVLEVATLSPK